MERLTVKSVMTDMVWFDGGSYQLEPCDMSYHETGEVLRKLEKYESMQEVIEKRIDDIKSSSDYPHNFKGQIVEDLEWVLSQIN